MKHVGETLAECVLRHVREDGCDLVAMSRCAQGEYVPIIDEPERRLMGWQYEDGSKLTCYGQEVEN